MRHNLDMATDTMERHEEMGEKQTKDLICDSSLSFDYLCVDTDLHNGSASPTSLETSNTTLSSTPPTTDTSLSSLEIKSCRFPTVSKLKGQSTSTYVVGTVSELFERPSTYESHIKHLKTAWALLLRSYVRTDHVAYGFMDCEDVGSGMTKIVTCNFRADLQRSVSILTSFLLFKTLVDAIPTIWCYRLG